MDQGGFDQRRSDKIAKNFVYCLGLNIFFKLYESLITFSFSTGFLFGKKKKCCVRGWL
jgi:hypothetical protein